MGAFQDFNEAVRLKQDFALAYSNRGFTRAYRHSGDVAKLTLLRNVIVPASLGFARTAKVGKGPRSPYLGGRQFPAQRKLHVVRDQRAEEEAPGFEVDAVFPPAGFFNGREFGPILDFRNAATARSASSNRTIDA